MEILNIWPLLKFTIAVSVCDPSIRYRQEVLPSPWFGILLTFLVLVTDRGRGVVKVDLPGEAWVDDAWPNGVGCRRSLGGRWPNDGGVADGFSVHGDNGTSAAFFIGTWPVMDVTRVCMCVRQGS